MPEMSEVRGSTTKPSWRRTRALGDGRRAPSSLLALCALLTAVIGLNACGTDAHSDDPNALSPSATEPLAPSTTDSSPDVGDSDAPASSTSPGSSSVSPPASGPPAGGSVGMSAGGTPGAAGSSDMVGGGTGPTNPTGTGGSVSVPAGTAGTSSAGSAAGGYDGDGGAGSPVSTGGGGTGGAGPGGAYQPPSETRTRTLIDDDWRFTRSNPNGAEAVGFDDSGWTPLSLPHSWNATDGADGGNNYYRGACWYRRHYTLPAAAAGKKVYLEFDGANIVTDVFVNGQNVGQHRGGFARFRFDVTDAMADGDNVIAVRVSNAGVDDVPPLEADFTFFGGIYRDVHVLITDPLHIDTMDYGSDGVYLDPTNVSAASAQLASRVRVTNDGSSDEPVTVETVVVDPDGAVVDTLSGSAMVSAAATSEVEASTTITSPRLWNGRAEPNVYSAYAIVRSADTVVDWVRVPLGFRYYSVDSDQGFFLNGSYLDLHGVNRHQDRIDKGWGIADSDQDEDMDLILELGATIVRLAHYEQAPHFLDLADRSGMILWEEVPLVNRISTSQAFSTNARQQLTEMIRQGYNHPSILFWGIGNEQRSDDAATNDLLDSLAGLVKSEDPNRLSTYAQCCTSDTGGLPGHSDVVGYNTYYGWYDAFGAADQFGAWADGVHAARPSWKMGISEWGAGAGITQHQEPPAQPDPYGSPHPEEWQNLVHESHWLQMQDRPYLWCKIVWAMFDFAVDSRSEGDTRGRNDKGLVSYDRKTKKDAFFWFKSFWSEEPVVYITSRRFTPRTTASTPIKIYSNLDSVELFVNGQSQGSKTSTDHRFIWSNVALGSGQNTIEARGTAGNDTITDMVTWTRN
jgi:beta-galactosidase